MAKKTEEQEIIIGVTKKQEPKKNGVPMPKKKKKKKVKNSEKRKKVIFALKYWALSALLITLILCAMFSPLFNIKNIQIEGNEKVTENEIISLSQIEVGINTFKLSKSKIKKQIKQNAYIGEITITRKLPSTILIQVEERKPAYLLEYAGGYINVDKQGYLLEITQEKLELPILQGAMTKSEDFVVGNRLCLEDLETLSSIAKIMEIAEINEIAEFITGIDIADKSNIKLIFGKQEKTAYLGDNSNLNTKILTIKSVLEKEDGKAGEIFVNIDLNKEYPIFRERV